MNAYQVARNAIMHTEQYRGVLADSIRRELAYAQVAHWLNAQDESVLAKAAKTATDAIASIGALMDA